MQGSTHFPDDSLRRCRLYLFFCFPLPRLRCIGLTLPTYDSEVLDSQRQAGSASDRPRQLQAQSSSLLGVLDAWQELVGGEPGFLGKLGGGFIQSNGTEHAD